MNSPSVINDQLLSRLQISRDTLQRLTHVQMTSLSAILERPPACLARVVAQMPSDKLKREFSRLNVPISAIEYPMNLLESYLRDLFVDWRMNGQERNLVLSALARYVSFLSLASQMTEIVPPTSSMCLCSFICGELSKRVSHLSHRFLKRISNQLSRSCRSIS
jgi:hypothetical protein